MHSIPRLILSPNRAVCRFRRNVEKLQGFFMQNLLFSGKTLGTELVNEFSKDSNLAQMMHLIVLCNHAKNEENPESSSEEKSKKRNF